MSKIYRPVPAEEVFADLPPARRARIKARADALIAEELALKDLRKARLFTQEQVAERLGGRQVYVSRLENRSDMKLSTLRDYVGALGGDLQLVVTFPEGPSVKLTDIGASGKSRARVRKAPASAAQRSARSPHR